MMGHSKRQPSPFQLGNLTHMLSRDDIQFSAIAEEARMDLMQPKYFLLPVIRNVVATKLVARLCVWLFVVYQVNPTLEIRGR